MAILFWINLQNLHFWRLVGLSPSGGPYEYSFDVYFL